MKMELIEGSETSAFKTQTPGKYPKENILHKEHGESLKSRNTFFIQFTVQFNYKISTEITTEFLSMCLLYTSFSLLFGGYLVSFPKDRAGLSVKLITHLHLVPRLRIGRATLLHLHPLTSQHGVYKDRSKYVTTFDCC